MLLTSGTSYAHTQYNPSFALILFQSLCMPPAASNFFASRFVLIHIYLFIQRRIDLRVTSRVSPALCYDRDMKVETGRSLKVATFTHLF